MVSFLPGLALMKTTVLKSMRTLKFIFQIGYPTLLHVHKNRTDNLPMCSVANEFVARNDSRIRKFGHF